MPVFNRQPERYKPAKDVVFAWDTFRKGLNTLLRENEIDKEELAQAENILLKGRGIPTKRWGTKQYFTSSNTTVAVRGLKGFYVSGPSGSNELLALTDEGYLVMKSGASYSTLTGASFASGYYASMAQLDNRMYIVNGQRELVRYSSPTLVGFPTIGIPSITGATNISNATGPTIKSYRVDAVSQVGQTLASSAFQLIGQPNTLGGAVGGVIRLFITPPSTASGILQSMTIYGRDSGNERFLGSLPGNATVFDDNGSAVPKEFTFPVNADLTGGPKCKFVKRFQDRLIYAGFDDSPSKVLISGRVPFHERFDIASGGNYILIEPNAGDDIVQIEIFRDRIIVFKNRSIWQITLTFEQVGNFFVTTPNLQLITASHGCIAPRSVVPVENDIYFVSRDGIRSLGYEAGFAFDVLRSNEISLKIRPFFKSLTVEQQENAVASYHEFKYLITFPGLNKTMIFDRERLAWLGPWTVDTSVFETYYDTENRVHLLYGNNEHAGIDEFSETFMDDNGTAIQTILRTRQEDFGDWSLFKNVKNIFTQFRNITGSLSVTTRLEQRNGSVVNAAAFTVTPNTGNSGWGADMWASAMWGDTNAAGGGSDSQQVIRWLQLNKAARTIQMTFTTTGSTDNYELLGIRGEAKPIGKGFRPSSWRVR